MIAAVSVAAVVVLLAGCSRSTAKTDAGTAAPGGELTIFAAASLTSSFNALGAAFAADHPHITVKPIVYDGSSTLATQLKEGARADVFASADEPTMAGLAGEGLIAGESEVFATNTVEIAVQPGNPHHIRGLADLARDDLTVILCAPQVPCGAASQKLLAGAGGGEAVHVTPASEEQNVTAVVTKVSAGEADAGLVYTTDVQASVGAVDGVTIANAAAALNRYMIAVPEAASNPAAGKAFMTWVRSAAGQAILERFGFGRP